MQFVPSFLMTTFFIQSCASLSCKMESHSVMYADGKQKEGQTNYNLVFCRKSRILNPSWRKHSKIYFKILFRTTAKGGLWKYLSYHYVEIAWKIMPFSYMIIQCPFCLFSTNFGLNREKQIIKATFKVNTTTTDPQRN